MKVNGSDEKTKTSHGKSLTQMNGGKCERQRSNDGMR